MKKRKTLKTIITLSAFLSVAGCGTATSEQTENKTESASSEGYSEKTIDCASFSVTFKQNEAKDSIYPYFYTKGATESSYYSDTPIAIVVRSKSSGIIETYTESTYYKGYDLLTETNNGYVLSSQVKTDNGSVFSVKDTYQNISDLIVVNREVEVIEANSKDAGFASSIKFKDQKPVTYDKYDYFMPSIIYKDTQDMVNGAIFSNTDLTGKIYVKETRTGLPMMYLRNQESNIAFSLAHIADNVSAGGNVGGGEGGEINNEIQYGSIGMTMTPDISVDFCYPCQEGPVTYDAGASWAKRYHSVEVGTKDNYKVAALLQKANDYQTSMTESFEKMFSIQNTAIESMNIDQIYNDNMEIFESEYKEYGSGSDLYGGEPWSLTLPNAEAKQGYSSQMGFVGQQIPVGYQMYRKGLMENDEELKRKGQTILNFWSSEKINGSYFPNVWWDPSDSGGSRRNYPCFLRCMIDGMEGMLDAYIVSKQYNEENTQYLSAVEKFAQNLVQKQNEDGSFYRAYNVDGSVNTDTSNSAYQGTSRLNTPVAVRFLFKMYELTDNNNYYLAAMKAVEYSYNELYLGLGKYVGGTPDNPNTVDKEAAVYAMYCFTSAYQVTKEEKYLAAAKHAAVSSLSWVYSYDFAVPCTSSVDSINTFKNGGVKGFSMIATGHSSADNYAAYIYYELFNLYVLSDDDFFYTASHFIQNNTKLSNDYDGRMNFKYKALMPEATTIADFDFKSVGTWLPWSSIANVEPIVNMEKTYGVKDVTKTSSSLDELKTKLENYGIGGISR